MSSSESPSTPAWTAILANTIAATFLTTSELLPVSVLTPIARDLRITEGTAGQMVTVSAVVGFIASLSAAVVVRNMDRRNMLLGLTALLVLSNVVSAVASNFGMMLMGRLLLGMAIAGFWSFSASIFLRLSSQAKLATAFMILFGGVAVSRIVAGPAATYLEPLTGWRNIYWALAILSVVTAALQWLTLPRLPARGNARLDDTIALLKDPAMFYGLAASLMSFIGMFVAFTYFRPFFETVSGMNVDGISAAFFWFGVAALAGSLLASRFLDWSMQHTMVLLPLTMAALSLLFFLFGSHAAIAMTLTALWALASSMFPIGWNTWIARTMAEKAEPAGGLLVASIQLGIALGAGLGGITFDQFGARGPFAVAIVVYGVCAALTLAAFRSGPRRVTA
jgi:predicted MFS family arabinose efflux permease